MKRALIAAALVLAAPGTAPAAASPFGEAPPRSVASGESCLRGTGALGETVRAHTRDNTSADGPEFLLTDAAGAVRTTKVRVEGINACPEAAARPGGAGIVAFHAFYSGPRSSALSAALREPGGAWGPVRDITDNDDLAGNRALAVGVSERADALLAVARHRAGDRIEIEAFRRAAGAGFGGRELLFSAARSRTGTTTVQAGMSATGEAIVAWAFQPRSGAARELWAAVAAPGAAFRAPVRVGELRRGSTFALAVGAGGDAVLAFPAGAELKVADRLPGADFGVAAPVGVADDLYAVLPTAAVRADGGAVVAWLNAVDGAMRAVARDRVGAFGPAVSVAPPVPLGISRGVLRVLLSPVESEDEYLPGFDSASGLPNAVMGAAGALVTWVGPALQGETWSDAPQSATLPAGGVEARVHGAGLDDAESAVPLLLEGGGAGVQWANNGVLHTAVEGLREQRDAAAPQVRVGAPEPRTLKLDDSLAFPVACSAACVVRAQVGTGALAPRATMRLTRAGAQELSLDATVGPIPTGTVPIHLRYGAPGARHAKTKTVVVHLRRSERLPRAERLVARREGDDVVVTWRTDRLAPLHTFTVWASAERDSSALAHAEAKTRGRRFSVRLRGVPTARYVTLATGNLDVLAHTGTVAVRG